MSHDFPTLSEVIAMHARLIEAFGGAAGLRDPGALEAALMRPFLRMNGHRIECDNEAAYAFFMQLFETQAFRFDRLEPWLREHLGVV
jgi:death-on-curing protein